jgi:hypothetical protein
MMRFVAALALAVAISLTARSECAQPSGPATVAHGVVQPPNRRATSYYAAWAKVIDAAPHPIAPVHSTFQGRIAWSADGNHNDPDDWAASPVALAIFAECGNKDRLVHFDYNCILPRTDRQWESIHAESVLGAAQRYGYRNSVFHDCQKDLDGALASIAQAINDSTEDNPLYFILAGPMEVPFRGIEKSHAHKRKFVYCISHSRWNDGFAAQYQFTHTKRSVIESGVNWVQIQDQNPLLARGQFGRPSTAIEEWQPYHWMSNSSDPRVRFLWERMRVSTRPDPSDAGMAYFLMTGDEQADPAKLQRLLDDKAVPKPISTRSRVRIEAENSRDIEGYELTDRNDKDTSHRLYIQRAKSGAARIRTQFNEPYTSPRGRYNVEVRCRDERDRLCRFEFYVNGVAQGAPWQSAGESHGWNTHTISAVEICAGDEIAVTTHGLTDLDYVQLNYLAPD